jgi:hypothetical protein
MSELEKGKWQIRKETVLGDSEGVAVDDASWVEFKAQIGSNIESVPNFLEYNPIRESVDKFATEVSGSTVSGEITTWHEAPTDIGDANELDVFFEVLTGEKRLTAEMTGLLIVDADTVSVPTVHANLRVNDAIRIPLQLIAAPATKLIHVAVVTAIDASGSPDLINIYPDIPTGYQLDSAVGADKILKGVYYKPKTGLLSCGLMRVEDTPGDNDIFTYHSAQIGQMVMDLTPGGQVQPRFSISAVQEIQDTDALSIAVPAKGKSFIMKGGQFVLDGVSLVWVSSIGFTYGNNITPKDGMEAPEAISGYYEGDRDITISVNFERSGAGEISAFRNATSRKLMVVGQRIMDDSSKRYFVIYFPNLIATALGKPVVGRIRKYEATYTAYQIEGTDGDDSMGFSLI